MPRWLQALLAVACFAVIAAGGYAGFVELKAQVVRDFVATRDKCLVGLQAYFSKAPKTDAMLADGRRCIAEGYITPSDVRAAQQTGG